MPAALGCQILKRVADQGREGEPREIPLETDKMDIWIQLKPLPACQGPGQELLAVQQGEVTRLAGVLTIKCGLCSTQKAKGRGDAEGCLGLGLLGLCLGPSCQRSRIQADLGIVAIVR